MAAVRERGALVEVVSDGFGFYVASNLAAIGVTDVFVATNENRVGEGGAGMSFPFGHPSCFVCGTCKRERVRLHQAAGRVVVFIGDGTSDRYGAHTPTWSSPRSRWRASVAPRAGRSSTGARSST